MYFLQQPLIMSFRNLCHSVTVPKKGVLQATLPSFLVDAYQLHLDKGSLHAQLRTWILIIGFPILRWYWV